MTDQNIILPTLERTLYDEKFGTDTRFGLGDEQIFVDPDVAKATVTAILTDPSRDFVGVDIDDFVNNQLNFTTPEDIISTMEAIYESFASDDVNYIFFQILQDAFVDKTEFEEFFKTSWVALQITQNVVNPQPVDPTDLNLQGGGGCFIGEVALTPTVTPSVTPSVTPDISPSFTPTPSVTGSPTPTPTLTPTLSLTPDVTPTVTSTIDVTPTPSPTSNPTPTATGSPTPTHTVTPTVTASLTASVTPTPSSTSGVTPTPTASATPGPTLSETPAVTVTQTAGLSPTPTPTATLTPNVTSSPTPTISETPTITPTLTMTPTPSVTPSSLGSPVLPQPVLPETAITYTGLGAPTAYVQLHFESDGQYGSSISSTGGVVSYDPNTWFDNEPIVGIGSGYQVRITYTGGDALPLTYTGPTIGTWHTISSNLIYRWEGPGSPEEFVEVDIEIRNASTLIVDAITQAVIIVGS